MSFSLPTLIQIYTFDSLFMLLGCNAGLKCFCWQIRQDSACSVVPRSQQDPQPPLPSRCIGTRGSWYGRKRGPDFPQCCLLAQAGMPLPGDLLAQVCPLQMGSPVIGSLLLLLPSSPVFSLPISSPV